MRVRRLLCIALPFGLWWLTLSGAKSAGSPLPGEEMANPRMFMARGVIKALNPENETVVISHEAISNYMAAMTMPFKIRNADELAGLRRGDEVTFRLHVSDTESWVDHLAKIGTVPLPPEQKPAGPLRPGNSLVASRNPLLDYKFTNELSQAISLSDFHGQALAITFFYTRCPLPDYCPRLSKNFEEVEQKLESQPGTPTNWHLLSISFDTEFDTPAMLKAYGDSYQYDPRHWSFLTGPADKIGALARESGVNYQADNGTFTHNFRTLIIDARGRLQMVFPMTGDFSDQIVTEIIKAAAATNQPVLRN